MTSSEAERGSISGETIGISKPNWRTRFLQFIGYWWPALFTGAAATGLASFLYVASALAFIEIQLDYGFGFAFGGMAANAIPPATVWAAMKWIK